MKLTRENALTIKYMLFAGRWQSPNASVAKRLRFNLDDATAYKTTAEEYGRAYKSKQNGGDLVVLVQEHEGLREPRVVAAFFGKDYGKGMVLEVVGRDRGCRPSWDFYVRVNHANVAYVVPQEQVSRLQREHVELKRARYLGAAPGTKRLKDRLRDYKVAKALKVDDQALRDRVRALTVRLTRYYDRELPPVEYGGVDRVSSLIDELDRKTALADEARALVNNADFDSRRGTGSPEYWEARRRALTERLGSAKLLLLEFTRYAERALRDLSAVEG